MEVISKDKPKGKAYSINKKMKKAKRLEEEKKFRRITENKRKNAENRKERAIEKAEAQRASEVILKGFSKGMLIISTGRLMKNPDEIFRQVKENVIRLFEKDLEDQVILHAKHQVKKKLEMALNCKIHSFEQLNDQVEEIHERIRVEDIYSQIKTSFQMYIETADYNNILRVYNQKGMLPQSRVCQLCGISTKEHYLDFVLSILRENKAEADVIRHAIKASLGM